MPAVDVIVLDIDGGAMLRACIESIRAQSVPPREIVVFDNGSRTPSNADGARIIRSASNVGFARGVNAAFGSTSGEYVALVNNDVVLDRDWLATIIDVLESAPRVAAVQTVIRRDEQTIDGAGIDISDGTFRQMGHGQPLWGAAHPGGVQPWGVSATAALYRRAALGDEVFNPRFFAYYEDVELCARLHAGGWKTFVVPRAKASHRGSSTASVLGRDALRLRTRNRYFVARMHPGVGRIGALLREDVRLLLRGRSSIRGVIEGLCSRL